MHTEQVRKVPFKMNITCSQVVRAERAFQSQLHMIIICDEACETILDHDFINITCSQLMPAKQAHFHLQRNHAC